VKSGPGLFNLKIAGSDVTVSATAGTASKNSCSGKFVDFPLK